MSTTLNTSANKPFLQNTMSQVLAYGQQATWTGTVTQASTTLTFQSTTSSGVALNVGSIIGISGKSTVTITALLGGLTAPFAPVSGNQVTVNVSQTADITTATSASASGSSWWGNVTQSGTTLTVATTTGGALTVGSLIYINGYLPVTVLSAGSSGTTWIVNSSQTIGSSTSAYTISYKVQNLLNTFLNGVSETNYNYLFAGISAGEYSITGPAGSSPNSALRTLITIDDGSVAIDTSKSTNLYVNFNNKIKIASTSVNASNADVEGTATLTIGTAGGNNINENHMSRPEMLLAMLSNNGTGFTTRYSSSLSAYQSYFAQRVGLTTEEPFGIIRLSVPAIV